MSEDPIGGGALVEVMTAYRAALSAHQREINRLNVFPVPDGDTGTNMTLTLDAVVEEIACLEPEQRGDAAAIATAISKGSLMGARGNSGVILCQVLRGLVAPALERESLGAKELAEAISAAASGARAAVMRPVEGTILSVADAAARRAQECASAGASIAELLGESRVAARDALWATPGQLPVLKEAGVVDAGGTGLLLLFDALLSVAADVPIPAELDLPPAVMVMLESALDPSDLVPPHVGAGVVGELSYEVMFLLESEEEAVAEFKERWSALGDSIVVVGGAGLWNCHIHTADIGAAIEAGIVAGRPREIRVTDLAHQVEEEAWVRESPLPGAGAGGAPPRTAVIAVATGAGIHRVFASLGADRLVTGGQSMNPSTAEILAAVEASAGESVVVLPNNSNIFPVAEQVAKLASKPVYVVPTRGVQEGFAALLAYDPGAAGAENARLMVSAAERVTAGEVTRAVRAARTAAGTVSSGDWIGLSRGGIESIGAGLADATTRLLGVLIAADSEIVTLITGEDAPASELAAIERYLAEQHPSITVERLEGGQPLYPLLISIE